MSALTEIHRKLLSEMNFIEVAIWYTDCKNAPYDMEQAAAELAALTARLAQAERERDELREALDPFAIDNPIGIPRQWQSDFDNAKNVIASLKSSQP